MIDSVRALKQQIDVGPGTLIYAGQAAFTIPSTQLGPRNWDAVVLVQYPSLASYNETAASDGYKDALAAFDEAYSHGMVRNPVLNLAIHQALLGLATIDIVTGNREVPPLVPSSETSGAPPQLNERVAPTPCVPNWEAAARTWPSWSPKSVNGSRTCPSPNPSLPMRSATGCLRASRRSYSTPPKSRR